MTSLTPVPEKSLKTPISSAQRRLLAIMLDPERPPEIRAEAGRDINQHGDPRPGVIDFNFGVDYWCKVPAGKFVYNQSHGRYASDSIDYDYWVGKYPITYGQFKLFLDDPNGYSNPQWWTGLNEQGLQQRWKGAAPQVSWPIANHPAVDVNWYDVMAFCAWLNTTLKLDQVLKSQGYVFRLPIEREWQKAARGTEGHDYPWGNDYRVGYANVNEESVGGTYLRQTTAVGIYPQGVSLYKALDMLGNVTEWTLSEYEHLDRYDFSTHQSRIKWGGSWVNSPINASLVNACGPVVRSDTIGFRVYCCPSIATILGNAEHAEGSHHER